MPVEVRELVIRAVIEDGQGGDPGGGSGSDHDKIVQECVEQVLKIIRKNQNR